MSKPFCENRRGARCFAELFGRLIRETIHAVMVSNRRVLLIFTYHAFFVFMNSLYICNLIKILFKCMYFVFLIVTNGSVL